MPTDHSVSHTRSNHSHAAPKSRFTSALHTLQSVFSLQNCIFTLLALYATSFVAHSTYQWLHYFNLSYIAYVTMIHDQTNHTIELADLSLKNIAQFTRKGKLTMRVLALAAVYAAFALGTMVSSTSLLYLALHLPLSLIILYDLHRAIFTHLPEKTSEENVFTYVRRCCNTVFVGLDPKKTPIHGTYVFIVMPLLLKTLTCGIVQLSRIATVASLPGFSTLAYVLQISLLSYVVSFVSLVAGVQVLVQKQQSILNWLQDQVNGFFQRVL